MPEHNEHPAGLRIEDGSQLASSVDLLTQMEAMWRVAFPGPRRESDGAASHSWLAQKLRREAYSISHSRLAWSSDRRLAAFFVVGSPVGRSLAGIGLVVDPKLRRQGLASKLMQLTIAAMSDDLEFERLVCDIEPALGPRYRTWGFESSGPHTHLLAPRKRGEVTQLAARLSKVNGFAWSASADPDLVTDPLLGWRIGNWHRTPDHQRGTFVCSPASRFGLSLEGPTLVVHWYEGHQLCEDLQQLSQAVGGVAAILVYGVSRSHPDLAALLRAGFHQLCPFERWVRATRTASPTNTPARSTGDG